MRVAMNGWFWDQPYTGSGQYLRQLLNALTELAPQLEMALVLPPHIRDIEAIPQGVMVIHAPTRWPGNLGKVWFEQRTFPSAAKIFNADIAHVPYWAPPLKSPARLVVSILDVIPLVLPEYRGGMLNQLYTSLVRAASEGVGHVITLSEASQADILEHLNVAPDHVTAIHLAADERFAPLGNAVQDEAVREKYGLPDEFALYFGGFDRRKNVNNLLLAWTWVGQPLGEHVPLVLAGREPERWGDVLFPDLKTYIEELNIQNYVIWLGEIDEADKPALYRLAKVMVYPSLYEGFGLPPLEAMASGTPVVAGNVSAMAEVLGEGAYLVDPTNAREMGGATLALLVQDDLHAHMVNMARGRATQFSWRKTAQQTLEVYEKVFNTPLD